MSDTPRVKRLFQPSINKYFQRVTNENAVPLEHLETEQLLSEHVQSSLLSVGMRVRRAVPGGYQNTKGSKAQPGPLRPMSPADGNRRELQPFCGLHKVGGFLQPQSASVQVEPFVDDDAWPLSSQESTASTASSASQPAALSTSKLQSRKRLMDEDSDIEGDFGMHPEPCATAPRAIAQPRKARWQRPVAPIPMDLSADFEEAPFLMPPE